MKHKLRYIVSILIVVAFYIYAIVEKALGFVSYTVSSILVNNLLLILLVLAIIYLLNKYYLKKTLSTFTQRKEKVIVYLSLGLLLLSIVYVIDSLGIITYRKWILNSHDNSTIENSLKDILSNKFYAFVLLGPFVWLNEAFGVISRVFILNNLWKLSNSRSWNWVAIITVSFLFVLLQIDKGLSDIINLFLIVLVSNIFYLKFRNIVPLIIAPVLYTTIDLIAFWVYNF